MPLPSVVEALWDLGDVLQYALLDKNVVDHQVVEAKAAVRYFRAVRQPVPKTRLMIKPEGQRSWQWWTLWTADVLPLDSIVQDPEGRRCRVMSQTNWAGGGFHEYEITEGVA